MKKEEKRQTGDKIIPLRFDLFNFWFTLKIFAHEIQIHIFFGKFIAKVKKYNNQIMWLFIKFHSNMINPFVQIMIIVVSKIFTKLLDDLFEWMDKSD